MATRLHTPLCDLLGCRYPIVQTAMGYVADARLVAATANAGGFGFLAGVTIAPPQLEQEILKVKSLTDKPFGLNFHMYQPNAAEAIDLAIKHRVRAVSFGRGPDKASIARLKAAGIVIMPTVGAVKHAQKAVEMGADVVTVQGGEGGGHTGGAATSILLPQTLDAVQVPVVAAGGFFDGRGLTAALAYGAVGIAMGTRFLMTAESPVPQNTLSRYLAVKDAGHIRVSEALDGLPQRMIDNEFLTHLENTSGLRRLLMSLRTAWKWKGQTGMSTAQLIGTGLRALKADSATASQVLMSANAPIVIQRAMVEGHPEEGVLPSGQVAAVINELPTVAALIEQIMAQAGERAAALEQLFSCSMEETV